MNKNSIFNYLTIGQTIEVSEELFKSTIHAVDRRGNRLSKNDPTPIVFNHLGGKLKIAVWFDDSIVSEITIIYIIDRRTHEEKIINFIPPWNGEKTLEIEF